MKIILSGADGVGKTTTAKALVELLKPQRPIIAVYSLGTALRELAIDLHLLTRLEAFAKPLTPEHRQVLRTVGQTARHIEPRYWVNRLNFADPNHWIVDDVKHWHDFKQLKFKGAFTVFLEGYAYDPSVASFEDLDKIKASSDYIINMIDARNFDLSPQDLAKVILREATNEQY